MRPVILRALLFFASVIFLSGNNFAQLVSPGELASVHVKLDGVQNCTKCHNFGEKTFRDQCLNCHTEIRSRIEARSGYHYTTRNLQCSACHKEHHGREFKLIRWDPGKFDHQQAGFQLEGKHSGKECKTCHNPANIKSVDMRSKMQSQKQRSFLGLQRNCGSCHADVHRDQFSNDCSQCHTPVGWKPPSLFSHAQARFKLLGKHTDVVCAKCHPTKNDAKQVNGSTSFLQFTGIKHGQCTDCHTDQHKNAFGQKCDQCHSPSGWKNVQLARENFNHAVTRFPLSGKHHSVTCDKCHKNSDWMGNKNKNFSRCTTCHEDYHRGQFVSRTDRGECSGCHDVHGFSPVRYDAAEHKNARFILKGAHLAIPCSKCHDKTVIDGKTTIRFRWDDFACTSCHRDEHEGQFAEKISAGGCESCHSVQSWQELRFDHEKTRFSLEGKHLSVPCEKCHKRITRNDRQTKQYRFENTACATCHPDVHQRQFASVDTDDTPCAGCHSPRGWKFVSFDHNKQSRFKLEGKHTPLACSKCHKQEIFPSGETATRFKPMDMECTFCHKKFD